MNKIICFVAFFSFCVSLFSGTISPTMVSGGEDGWKVASDSVVGLQLGLRARTDSGAVTIDRKGVYTVRSGNGLIEFSIRSEQTLTPLEPTEGYFKFYLRLEGKKPLVIEPLFYWDDNYFMTPDNITFQGPGDWYTGVSNVSQGSHELLTAGKYTLYALSDTGALVLKVEMEVRFVK